jgi:N-acetylmuramoyl-L-alanine amidase
LASRANHGLLSGLALLCVAALPCAGGNLVRTAEAQQVTAPAFPVASDARLAGDGKQTRFVLDLDKTITFRAFTLADPYRVVIDVPQVDFRLPIGTGATGRGLIKAFRYGLVMPGGSRIVIDLTGPARIANTYMLDAANGQPPRLVLEFEQVDQATFSQSLGTESRPELRPAITNNSAAAGPVVIPQVVVTPRAAVAPPAAIVPQAVIAPQAAVAPPAAVAPQAAVTPQAAAKPFAPKPAAPPDSRPVVVIDPGHGGIDNGTQSGDATEKDLVLGFGLALRDRLEKSGKYRVVMTRTDDTFIPLGDRVRIAHDQSAALFVSIHADALPRGEGDAQGATIYTLSDKASDAEAERLAEAENRADAIGGVNLTEEPTEVADILIDLARRETRTFSNRFARLLMNDMKSTVRMHKNPLKSAGFKVLKAPDIPSVLVELGYVSNKGDLEHLVSETWRDRTVGAMAQAIDVFLAKRLATAGSAK